MNAARIRLLATIVITACITTVGLDWLDALYLDSRQTIAIVIIVVAAGVVSTFADKLARAFQDF